MTRSAYVFFSTATADKYGVAWWVTTLTRSPLTHTAIAYDGAVLNPTVNGDTFWPLATFAERFPRLAFCFTVPLDHPLDLDDGYDPSPRRIWPTVLRWLLGGRLATRDCVAVVARHLRTGGARVPDSVVSPQDLYDHLTAERYEVTLFDGV